MLKSVIPLSLAALIAAGTAAMAEETSDTGTAGEAELPADQGLDLGEPVDTGPQLGQRYVKEEHGDWDLVCIKTEAETDPCSMLQILNGPQGNPMSEVTLFRIDQAQGGSAAAGATIIVPLETLIPAGIMISIDGAPGKRYNYRYCDPVGCVANIGLTGQDIEALKKGTEATVSLRPAQFPDQLLEMKMSLKGFTAGYDVVDVVQP